MSTTDKLARSLQTLLANDDKGIAHSNDELFDAHEALDEYHRSSPAVEVTADAVGIVVRMLFGDIPITGTPLSEKVQAALSAALPVLTQQVERLRNLLLECRCEIERAPHSLGYEYTLLPKIDAATAQAKQAEGTK